jgi:TonB family protein
MRTEDQHGESKPRCSRGTGSKQVYCIHQMRRWFLFALVVTFCSSLSCIGPELASDTDAWVSSEPLVTLKVACNKEVLHFDLQGQLLEQCPQGIWTIDSGFMITGLERGRRQLVLKGNRVAYGWKDGKRVHWDLNKPISVVIDSNGPMNEGVISSLLDAVLVSFGEEQQLDLPPLWQEFVKTGEVKPNPVPNVPGTWMLRKKVQPSYPEAAMHWRVQGKVVFSALIGKDGKIVKLAIARPAGFGLDEAAAEAVAHWEYEPYRINGKSVDAHIFIHVPFTLKGDRPGEVANVTTLGY